MQETSSFIKSPLRSTSSSSLWTTEETLLCAAPGVSALGSTNGYFPAPQQVRQTIERRDYASPSEIKRFVKERSIGNISLRIVCLTSNCQGEKEIKDVFLFVFCGTPCSSLELLTEQKVNPATWWTDKTLTKTLTTNNTSGLESLSFYNTLCEIISTFVCVFMYLLYACMTTWSRLNKQCFWFEDIQDIWHLPGYKRTKLFVTQRNKQNQGFGEA